MTVAIISKIHPLSSKFVIPLLVLLCTLLGIVLLYSADHAFIIFALVVVPLAIFAEPFIGVMLYLLCLYTRPFDILPALKNIPVMKFLAIGTMALWLLSVLIYRKRSFVKAPQNILLVAFLAVMMASNRTYVHGALNVFNDFSKIVIIYFLIANLTNTERRLKIATWILLISTTYMAVQGILLSRGISIGGAVETVQAIGQENRIQSTGIFKDPNALALALVMAVPFVFNFFFHERHIVNKVLLVAIGSILLYGTLLTASRGGMIGLGVVMFLLLKKKFGFPIGIALTVVSSIGLMILAPSYLVERMDSSALQEDEGTGRMRLVFWYNGWLMLKSNPLLGVGAYRYVDFNRYGYHAFAAHNSFVHVAAELGLIGAFIWLGLFYFTFRDCTAISRMADHISRAAVVAESLKVSLIGFAVCGYFISRQYSYEPYIVMGLSVAANSISKGPAQIGGGVPLVKHLIKIFLITVGFCIVWVASFRLFL